MSEQDVSYAWIQIQTADGAVYPFAIDPESYIKRDIVDFAPRSGGGDVAYSNLDLYQIVTQDSWHHGIGFIQFRDKFGYRITSDGVDTRHVGMALLFPKYTVEYAAGSGGLKGSVDFGGSTYLNMGSNGVWKRTTGGTYTKVLTANVNDLLTNGAYLIATVSGGRMVTSSNGTSWSNAGVSGNPPNSLNQLEIHNGFMWGSEAATASKTLTGTNGTTETLTAGLGYVLLGIGTGFLAELAPNDLVRIGSTAVVRVLEIYSNTLYYATVIVGGSVTNTNNLYKQTSGPNYDCVHFWSSADSSDAEGGGLSDVGAITVGAGSPGIKAIASFNGALHIARPDGVWAVDDTVSPPVARRVLSFDDEQHSSNFAIFIPWRGRLYFNIKNALYAYNGSSLANVTPPIYSLNFPPMSFGGFIGATYRGPYLYSLASTVGNVNDGGSTVEYHLLAFDGTGWFSLRYLGTSSPTGMGYSPLTDKLFIGITGGTVVSVPFLSSSELPYADFTTGFSADNRLYLSEIDFGFRRVKKSFAEIDVEIYNISAGHRYAFVAYNPDGAGWNILGNTQSNGVNQLIMSPTVEANKLDVRINITTDDAAQSPILRNVTVKAMIRPDTLYGHQVVLVGGNEIRMLDNRFSPGSSEQQKQWIEAVRNSKAPITFVDPFGVSHTGYVSTAQFIDISRRPGESQSNWRCRINLVEVR